MKTIKNLHVFHADGHYHDYFRYQEYGDKCPGLSWTADADGNNVVDEAIMYGDGEDSMGDLAPSPEWPNALIQ